MTREPIDFKYEDIIYCLKARSNYHSEICDECKYHCDCDRMFLDDLNEIVINILSLIGRVEEGDKE